MRNYLYSLYFLSRSGYLEDADEKLQRNETSRRVRNYAWHRKFQHMSKFCQFFSVLGRKNYF